MAHVAVPIHQALTYDPNGGKCCPCKQCRPKGMSFKVALRRAVEQAELNAYGPEGVARRKAEQRERLAQLNKGK